MSVLAYTSDARRPGKGWDSLDRMVLWTFSASPRQSFTDVVRLLPTGLHFRLVHKSLAVLVEQGMLSRDSQMGPWALTEAGANAVTALQTRKAA